MRYDIIYTVYLPEFGEIHLYFDTIRVSGYYTYISGYDNDHNLIELKMDRLVYPDDHPGECGYCHIIAHTMHGETVSCNHYKCIQ